MKFTFIIFVSSKGIPCPEKVRMGSDIRDLVKTAGQILEMFPTVASASFITICHFRPYHFREHAQNIVWYGHTKFEP